MSTNRTFNLLAELRPAIYFPIERERYEVAPGLKPLGFDFGNGSTDAKVLQLDREFGRYQGEKTAARREDINKYYLVSALSTEARAAVIRKLLALMTGEYPQIFELRELPAERLNLRCNHTLQTLSFTRIGELLEIDGDLPSPKYADAIDALMNQLQEDVAVVSVAPRGDAANWLSLLHVSLPSHWAPGEKIGRDFASFHAPVPGFERMAMVQQQLVDAMINKGPYVRFVWSFVTDTRLNHHPTAPVGTNVEIWRGRTFDPQLRSPFFLRVERQVTLGLPEVNSALFFIRVSFIDGLAIRENSAQCTQLLGALRSMTSESRRYKGIEPCFDELVAWLERKA